MKSWAPKKSLKKEESFHWFFIPVENLLSSQEHARRGRPLKKGERVHQKKQPVFQRYFLPVGTAFCCKTKAVKKAKHSLHTFLLKARARKGPLQKKGTAAFFCPLFLLCRVGGSLFFRETASDCMIMFVTWNVSKARFFSLLLYSQIWLLPRSIHGLSMLSQFLLPPPFLSLQLHQ